MPEERQIGRGPAIDRLEAELNATVHQWLIGERRIGKTSVAKAVLARFHKRGSVALDIDLSKHELRTSDDLAGEIARQVKAAQVDGSGGLDKVLGALSLHARATGRHAFVLLDEVHLLADLDRAVYQVAHSCREPDSPIVFVLAGSEETSVRALREDGALVAIGSEFEVPEIALEDWLHGLRRRFAEVDVEIEDGLLDQIVSASAGHPRRTMLVASKIHIAASQQPDRIATASIVELAIRDAREDRSWR